MEKKDNKKNKKNIYKDVFINTHFFLKKSGFFIFGRILYLSIITGLFASIGAIVFMYLLNWTQEFFLYKLLNLDRGGMKAIIFESDYRKWFILILPAFGALISGFLTSRYAPAAKGHGTDYVVKSYHKEGANINLSTTFIKLIATCFTIGTGGSAGREGPIAQIGAGLGSNLAKLLKVSIREKRIMLIAGAGAGIGAIFGAPIGGALFACEVLYKNHDIEAEAILPAIISSIISYSFFKLLTGIKSVFVIPPVSFNSIFELFSYLILGILCAVVGIFYVKIFEKFKIEFEKLKVKDYLKPAIGGFFLGTLALFFPQILAGGYQYIEMTFQEKIPLYLALILVFAKIFATSFTISSGGSGGVFAPSLFIGAMLGSATGIILHKILPAFMLPSVSAFSVVGMGGFFAGVARVPLSSIILVSEMTKGYELLVPMMLVSAVAFLLNRKPYTLYKEQVNELLSSPVHKVEFESEILKSIKIKDIDYEKKMLLLPRRKKLIDVLNQIIDSKFDLFPVIDFQNNKLTGIVSFDDIRKILNEQNSLEFIIIDDITNKDFVYVKPEDTLIMAIEKLLTTDMDALPVLDETNKNILGILTRMNILSAYKQKLFKLRK